VSRVHVVTGVASGIGKATRAVLEAAGDRVIGVDLHHADITADLTTSEGRATLVTEVQTLSGGSIDGVLAIAGLATPSPAVVGVNYFGTLATLEGLRPLLADSAAPRAVAVSSMAALMDVDGELERLLAEGDEAGALTRAQTLLDTSPPGGDRIYPTTKRALSRWVRRVAATDAWAGAGIPLNVVAPGVIRTAMVADMLATPAGVASLKQFVPMPLNGFAEPEVVAQLLAWLVSVHNSHLCGQIVYLDGGSDVVMRGDDIW
jgi:NAD(P)-dependent dehydrogenase (short-subunit alcohol dehydrogenase family)